MVMGKDKLKRFAELRTFPNVIEPITDYSEKKHTAKGTWNQIFKKPKPNNSRIRNMERWS